MKYAWIDQVRDAYPLQGLCEVLSVSPSGLADWKACGGPSQWLSDTQMLVLIRSIHAQVRGCYGSPRMFEELKAQGFPASKARVRKLIQANGIRARDTRRYEATTDSKYTLPVAPNTRLRGRDVSAHGSAGGSGARGAQGRRRLLSALRFHGLTTPVKRRTRSGKLLGPGVSRSPAPWRRSRPPRTPLAVHRDASKRVRLPISACSTARGRL